MKRRVVLSGLSVLTLVLVAALADQQRISSSPSTSDLVATTRSTDPAPVLQNSAPPPSALGADEAIPAVAQHIFDLGERRGFAGLYTDYQNLAITVYWKASAPEDVREYVGSRPHGVHVTLVEGARYSRAESEAARARIQNDPIARELRIVSMSTGYQGQGLVIGVMQTTPLTEEQSRRLNAIAGIDGIEVNLGQAETRGFPAHAK